MHKRPHLALLCLVFGGLGLLLALGDFGRLIHHPVERLAELRRMPPTPRSVFWVDGLKAADTTLGDLERPLIGLSVVLLLGVLLLLGATLSPRFQLLKAPDENPGSGLSSHVNLGQLMRVAVAALFTLWLVGALAPLGWLVSGGKPTALSTALGGLPTWTLFAGSGRSLVFALILAPLLWWLWGPRGPLFPSQDVSLAEVLATGFFAAAAFHPAILALFDARGWVYEARTAYSIADRAGWSQLTMLAFLLPVGACVYLALVTRLFRPRALSSRLTIAMAAGALVAVIGGSLAERQGRAALDRLDVGSRSLSAELGLPPSDLQRFAVILTPRGRVVRSFTMDGVIAAGPDDQINSHAAAQEAVRTFVDRRNYRSSLIQAAFKYLNDCRALDWDSSHSLRLELAMLERAPSPEVAEHLMLTLSQCPITPENRAVLDRIADPAHFVWPDPEGKRRLGAAYLRFGDLKRSREYLLKAQLNQEEARQLLGGIQPVASGVVRGQVTVEGKPVKAVRLGLVDAMLWPQIAGFRRPSDWGFVLESAHTDEQGHFEFRNVPQGQYVLVITGGGVGTRGRTSVENPPGAIEINPFQPERTLAPFDLRFSRPAGSPPPMDPNTTVQAVIPFV